MNKILILITKISVTTITSQFKSDKLHLFVDAQNGSRKIDSFICRRRLSYRCLSQTIITIRDGANNKISKFIVT